MNFEMDVAAIRSGTKKLAVTIDVITLSRKKDASGRSSRLYLEATLITQIDLAVIG